MRCGVSAQADTFFIVRGRGGACPARGFVVMTILRANRVYGFPRWGKLSPQVTDEGENCGCRPFARRGGVTPPYGAIKNIAR